MIFLVGHFPSSYLFCKIILRIALVERRNSAVRQLRPASRSAKKKHDFPTQTKLLSGEQNEDNSSYNDMWRKLPSRKPGDHLGENTWLRAHADYIEYGLFAHRPDRNSELIVS